MQADMPQTHIVVHDPEGLYWEGALVGAEHDVPALRGRGVVTLPIDADLVTRSAVAGYFRRAWGAGWPIGSAVPRMNCPLVLYVMAGDGRERINWVARIVPESAEMAREMREGRRFVGTIRLTADSGQPGAFGGGFSATADTTADLARLPPMDANGGWTVYGGGRIHAPGNNLIGFGLYGSVLGARVAWAAISQSR